MLDIPSPPAHEHGQLPTHGVQVYDHEEFLYDSICDFLAQGLARGDSALAVATQIVWQGVAKRLRSRGFDLERLTEIGRVQVLEPDAVLDLIMVDGMPDLSLFESRILPALSMLAQKSTTGHIVATGEAVGCLMRDGNPEAALVLEQLWGQASRSHNVSIYCFYDVSTFDGQAGDGALHRICQAHDYVVPPKPRATDDVREPSRTAAIVQHQITALKKALHARGPHAADELPEQSASNDELAMIGAAGEVLSASLDIDTILAHLSTLALPALGDFACLNIAAEDGAARRVAVAHRDPRIETLLVTGSQWEARGELCAGPAGKTIVCSNIDDAWMCAHAKNDIELIEMRKLGFGSLVSVPLRCRERTFGSMTLFFGEGGRQHRSTEVRLAEDLARRAAAALENARLYAELETALRARAEGDRRKDEFLAMLGHELRNPLAPIRTSLELMRMRGETNREHAIMERHVQHVARLVDDLLDISRVTRGKVTLQSEPTEVSSVVRQASELVAELVSERHHELTLDVPQEGLRVSCDPHRLAQILGNLLHNAAKYTDPHGHITLSARRREGKVEIEVKDDGVGIEAKMLPRLFELFVQEQRSLDRARGGLGVGLALARSMTELHGGTLRAESDGPGKGSRFVVELPALEEPMIERAPAGIEAADTASRRANVLIVDDNVDAADLLAEALGYFGHDVRVAYTAAEAIALAATRRPDVAVLDISLPDMLGTELARELRRLPGPSPLMTVALSGYARFPGGSGKGTDFDLHLVKPVDLRRLAQVIGGRVLEPA